MASYRLVSLSTLVLNSRDQQGMYGTHWYSNNNALRLLNKAKSRLFRSIMNFKNFENHVDFVCRPASQPAVRPGCTRCRALKITQNNRLLRRIYESVVPKTIFLPCHGGSFVLPYITFFSIDWNA